LLANQTDQVFFGQTIPAGHLVIGLRTLASKSLVTYQQLRTVLAKLTDFDQIKTEVIYSGHGRRSATHITICNWELYKPMQRNSNAIINPYNILDENNLSQDRTRSPTQISVSFKELGKESTTESSSGNGGLFEIDV